MHTSIPPGVPRQLMVPHPPQHNPHIQMRKRNRPPPTTLHSMHARRRTIKGKVWVVDPAEPRCQARCLVQLAAANAGVTRAGMQLQGQHIRALTSTHSGLTQRGTASTCTSTAAATKRRQSVQARGGLSPRAHRLRRPGGSAFPHLALQQGHAQDGEYEPEHQRKHGDVDDSGQGTHQGQHHNLRRRGAHTKGGGRSRVGTPTRDMLRGTRIYGRPCCPPHPPSQQAHTFTAKQPHSKPNNPIPKTTHPCERRAQAPACACTPASRHVRAPASRHVQTHLHALRANQEPQGPQRAESA